MSKFRFFVCVYSIVMVVMFFTFCFLMTTVNPPPVKEVVNIPINLARRLGSDDLIYSDEFLPNDKIAYGLEKAEDDYNSMDVFAKRMPKLHLDKKYKTNCTRKETVKTITKSMIHVKGLRRSINKENQQDDRIARSVHLKIKDLDGRPKIEIQVVPERSKKIRNYRSSANITNNTQKFDNNDDMTDYVYENNSKEVIVVIENNEKLVLDFAKDSINLFNDYNLDSVDEFVIKSNKDANLLNNNISEYNTTYNNLFNISFKENIFKRVMMNETELKETDIESTTQIIKSEKNEVNSTEVLYNSVYCFVTKTKKDFTTKSTRDFTTKSTKDFTTKSTKDFTTKSTKDYNVTTKSHTPSNDRKTDETSPIVISVNTLVGLLIPEATATLPFNYHFINK